MRLAFELVESEQTVLPSVGGGSEYNKKMAGFAFYFPSACWSWDIASHPLWPSDCA